MDSREKTDHIITTTQRLIQLVPVTFVDTKALDRAASNPLWNRLINLKVFQISCFEDPETIFSTVQTAGVRYNNMKRDDQAAVKVQATWRMYQARSIYKRIFPYIKAVKVLQKMWRRYKGMEPLRRAMKDVHKERIKKSDLMFESMLTTWTRIMTGTRIVVCVVNRTSEGVVKSPVLAASW
jgi:hypothetical protein